MMRTKPFDSVLDHSWLKVLWRERGSVRNRKENLGLTLVELLVVIAILAILAGLLMPALKKSLDAAYRIDCLNRKRNLALAVFQFAGDCQDRLPMQTLWHDINNPTGEMGDGIGGDGDVFPNCLLTENVQPQGTTRTFPLGTLAAKGYVPNWEILFCPTYIRSDNYVNAYEKPGWHWETIDGYWNEFIDGDRDGLTGRTWTAVSLHVATGLDRSDVLEPRLTFSRLSSKWRDENYSPLILYDTNYGGVKRDSNAYTSYELSGKKNYWNGCHGQGRGLGGIAAFAPVGEGVNGVFYDGSGRWIPFEEVGAASGFDPGSLIGSCVYGGSFRRNWLPHWAMKWATPTRL
ncbi:MAG: type II secretion system protein [Planctomycetes bacterium]|nr:type II secretion system protein [Planctomycetota bacterium]